MSFYIVRSGELAKVADSEFATLKDAEKALRSANPGTYLVAQVVRTALIEEVPSTVRVQMAATRTRAPRDPNAPRKPRKPRAPKAPKPS